MLHRYLPPKNLMVAYRDPKEKEFLIFGDDILDNDVCHLPETPHFTITWDSVRQRRDCMVNYTRPVDNPATRI